MEAMTNEPEDVSPDPIITQTWDELIHGEQELVSPGSQTPGAPITPTPAIVAVASDYKSPNFTSGLSGWKLGSNGVIEAIGVILSGSISATSGTIGGFTIGVTTVTSTGLTLASGSGAYLAFGATPPTSATVGTGLFINATGLYGLEANTQNFKISATDGSITSIKGTMAGWTVTSTSLSSVSGGNTTIVSSGATAFTAGPTGSPTFTVTQAGALTATSGTIANWTLSTSALSTGAFDTINTMYFGTSGISLSDVFKVTSAGVLTASSGTIGGNVLSSTTIGSTTFVSGPLGSGWQISNTGTAEFQNITARGVIRTSVFEKDTISAVNGIVLVSSADVLNADMTALDSSTLTIKGETTFSANEVIRIKDGTDDEWMLVTNAASAPTYTVTRDLAGSYASNNNPIWKKGTAVVSMGVGTGTKTGFVLIDSSSANSPYIDIYGRNSNTYSDYTIHGRFGWLKGITDADVGLSSTDVWGLYTDNAYLKGVIVANTGYIGGTSGWVIAANTIKDVAGLVGLSNTVTGGNDLRIWAGHATPTSAPLRIYEDGSIVATNGDFSGTFNIGGTNITVDTIAEVYTALTTVEAAGGGTVYLQNGTYTLTADITIPGGVTLEGVSRDGVILDCDGTYAVKIAGTNVYSTGTVTINNGDTTVVGSGTTWTAGMIGRYILLDGLWYEITARSDNTHITITTYQGTNLSGSAYVLADTNFSAIIQNVTITGATGSGLVVQYAQESQLNNLVIYDCGTGIDMDYVVFPKLEVTSSENGVNLNMNFVEGFSIDFSEFNFSTTGNGITMTDTRNATFFNSSVNDNTGDGINMTTCSKIAFISFDISGNGGQGVEMVSACNDNQFTDGVMDGNTSDGLKLTATSDRNTFVAMSIKNSGGYGINIAASTCDNNQIIAPAFDNNTSGNINDLGVNTSVLPDVAITLLPTPGYPTSSAGIGKQHNTNTTGYTGSFQISSGITLNKITFYVSAVAASGTVKIGIFSADGQNRYCNETTGTISSGGAIFTHTMSAPIKLSGGRYYFVIVPVSTTDITITEYQVFTTVAAALNPLSSEPKLYGTLTVTAGTLPTSFSPSADITDSTTALLPVMRFDN